MSEKLLTVLMLLVCIGCTDSRLPKSGGRPYEVLVTGSNEAANQRLASQLRALRTEALPQAEPLLDVAVLTANGLTQRSRYARNLIVLTTGDSARLQYERNAFAEPQLLVSLSMTTEGQFAPVREIADLIVRAELNNAIMGLRKKHHAEAERLVGERFGHRLWVPEDLTRMKQGNDFLWFSNDVARGMQNICIFRYSSAEGLSHETLLSKADSMLRINIPGEEEGMWMKLARCESRQEGHVLATRGLWEMEGDAMGGPFVSHSIHQGDSTLTALAFVYAPGQKKRNMMRRLEAALYTLK